MKKVRIILSGGALAIIALLTGCAKNEIPPKGATTSSMNSLMDGTGTTDSNLVDSSMVAYVASYYNSDVFLNQSTGNAQRLIASAYSISDKNGTPALYVFNYTDNDGYLVVSADFRYQPILLLSETGNLNKTDKIPSMLGSWFARMVENVELLRDRKYDNTAIGYHEWNVLIKDRLPFNPIYLSPNDPTLGEGGWDCPPVNYTKGPLLQTTWGQGCYYNDYTPTCSSGGSCGHSFTGCVATAMAQVIKYWHPNTQNYYNYAVMPNNNGNPEVARLMHDAGLSVNMTYGCDESGAYSQDVAHALTANFGIATAVYSHTFNGGSDFFQTIEGDLDYNKPVILGGCTDHPSIFHWTYGACHEWVCDGYRNQGTTCGVQTWAHMNWGWETNGTWSYIDSWNSGSTSYQYAQDFTYNIHP